MADLAEREFAVLRETIRSRGGTRPIVCLIGIIAWAVVLTAVLSWLANPIASVVPLLILATTFEVIRSLHLGVERIGRYLQVYFEADASGSTPTSPPAWEHAAMAFGPSLPGAGVHPYFLAVFLMATFVNFLGVIFPGPVLIELVSLAVPHVGFVIWVLYCDAAMKRQRASELARFRQLRS